MTDVRPTDRSSVLVTGVEVHADAARFFVGMAKALDSPEGPDKLFVARPTWCLDPLQNVSLAAVLNSYSAVEAFLNEIYRCQSENLFIVFQGLDKELARKLDGAWNAGADRFNVRDKTDLALVIADAAPMNWAAGVAQHLLLLGKLRNELVHHKARWIDDSKSGSKSDDKLEKQLMGLFPLAHFPGLGNPPFRWSQCLSAGCAEWAWKTVRDFMNEVAERLKLGLPVRNF